MKKILYHVTPHKLVGELRPNYQGIHLASKLEICKSLIANRAQALNTLHLYKVTVEFAGLRCLKSNIDLMDWGANGVAKLLLARYYDSTVEGASEGIKDDGSNWDDNIPGKQAVDMSDDEISKLQPDDLALLESLVKNKDRSVEGLAKVQELLGWVFNINCIIYKNYGENSLGDPCLMLFNSQPIVCYEEISTANLLESKSSKEDAAAKIISYTDRPWSYNDIEFWTNPKDGCCNATILIDGVRTRLRASMLVLKNDEILLAEDPDRPGDYSLPGGGFEPDETPVDAAIRETQEEVYINVKNARDTGYDYCEQHDEVMPWVKKNVPKRKWWYNYYTCLVIADYDSEYTGKVDKADQDPEIKNTCKWFKVADVINKPSFKSQWKLALLDFYNPNQISTESLTESLQLIEDTRTTQIANSRSKGIYKDQSRGKNRFDRKRYSKVANYVKQYNNIDMNDFFKKDILLVKVPVTGETAEYLVSIKIEGVCAEIARNIKSNNNQLEFRTVIQALTKIFNTTDVYTNCTCADQKYRFAHWNIVHNISTDDTAHDPGPGKGIRNPNDDLGRGCKHILLVLNNGDWLMKVASVINNYIHYAEKNMQKAFMSIIFPKLYGVAADEAAEQGLVPEDIDIETSTDIIDIINDFGKNRGKYAKGTNKNPVTGTGGRQKTGQPESDEIK